MKKIISFVLVLLPLLAFCQDNAESKIYTAAILKKGLYKNYNEFINNSPSITTAFMVAERDSSRGGNPYEYIMKNGTAPTGIWGFCDGQDVYVKGLRIEGYCKLNYIGKYSFFYTIEGVELKTLELPSHMLIIEEGGKYKDATVGNVYKLIYSKNKALAQEFNKQDDQEDERARYLIKLNEWLENME